MYNRYLNAEGFAEYFAPQAEAPAAPAQPERPPQPAQPAQPQPQQQDRQSQGRRPGLLGSLRLPELDADTILLLVLVYFLISDNDENSNQDKNSVVDTLLIVGALLLLGC